MCKSPDGIKLHNYAQHPGAIEAFFRMHAPFVRKDARSPKDGKLYCLRAYPSKIVYETLDEAWLAAFVHFARCGTIPNPYRCLYGSKGKAKVNGKQQRRRGCGRWHLTTHHDSILGA